MALPMYGTVELAGDYFDEIEVSGTWGSYSAAQQTAALKKATAQIDKLPFIGWKYQYPQTLEFPRIFERNGQIVCLDLTTTGAITVPPVVLEAAYIQAKFLLDAETDDTVTAIRNGITSQSIGGTSESYDRELLPLDTKTGLCREALALLTPYLTTGH